MVKQKGTSSKQGPAQVAIGIAKPMRAVFHWIKFKMYKLIQHIVTAQTFFIRDIRAIFELLIDSRNSFVGKNYIPLSKLFDLW